LEILGMCPGGGGAGGYAHALQRGYAQARRFLRDGPPRRICDLASRAAKHPKRWLTAQVRLARCLRATSRQDGRESGPVVWKYLRARSIRFCLSWSDYRYGGGGAGGRMPGSVTVRAVDVTFAGACRGSARSVVRQAGCEARIAPFVRPTGRQNI